MDELSVHEATTSSNRIQKIVGTKFKEYERKASAAAEKETSNHTSFSTQLSLKRFDSSFFLYVAYYTLVSSTGNKNLNGSKRKLRHG